MSVYALSKEEIKDEDFTATNHSIKPYGRRIYQDERCL